MLLYKCGDFLNIGATSSLDILLRIFPKNAPRGMILLTKLSQADLSKLSISYVGLGGR